MRRLLAALVLAAGVAMAPARAQAPDGAEDRLGQVQTVLDARVAAVGRGDRQAWLATVDPAAPAAFRAAQARSFDGLRTLPLSTYRLTARLEDSGDLGSHLSPRYQGAPTFLPETRQSYRFRGYDERDAVDTLWLTFVRRDGRWYVGGDADLADLGLDTARNLWDLGPVRVAPTTHFLVLSRPDQAARADALAGIAEEAAGLLERRWDRPWSGRIPLILPGSIEELETMLQSTFDLDNFVAFVVYGATRDTGWDATAPRIFIQDRNLSRYGRGFQLETLVHELVHAATVAIVGPFIPGWVHEGTADWVAKGGPEGGDISARPPRGSDGRLPLDFEFTSGGGSAILRSYDESRSATAFLAQRWGQGAPSTLLGALGRPRVAPGNADYHVDQALRQVTGLDLAGFQRTWYGR